MSRRHKQPQQRPLGIAWPVIVLGALLVAGAAFLFSRQASGAGGEGSGTGQISVDQPKIDYGYVKFGENRQFKIAVTNNGSGPLRFKAKPYIEVLEGC